jgi:hypothetical protein
VFWLFYDSLFGIRVWQYWGPLADTHSCLSLVDDDSIATSGEGQGGTTRDP